MNERPPPFGSKRFREIIWPAFGGDALAMLKGLYWFATRRRVRGWATLLRAAAMGPQSYERWIKHGERRMFDHFRQMHPSCRKPPIVALIIVEEGADECAASHSADSLRVAFGEGAPIHIVSRDGLLSRSTGDPTLSAAIGHLLETAEEAWAVAILAGDVVAPELGEVISRALTNNPSSAIIYWDEDCTSEAGRTDPWIKPGWDPLLFSQLEGLVGASAFSLAAAAAVARAKRGLAANRAGFAEMLFKLANDRSHSGPNHVALVLTHRSRASPLAIKPWVPAQWDPSDNRSWPSVSILIPTRDRADLLSACIQGIDATVYPGAIEIIIVDNGSREGAALELLHRLEDDSRARVLRDPGSFNFSRLCNRGASVAAGEILCFLNNDVDPIDSDWLTSMVAHAQNDDVGAVGALLLYPSGRIQHCGVAVGIGGAAGHLQKGVQPSDLRFWTWHRVTREVTAVTAAAMVMKKNVFVASGGFDETAFAVAFNDVDLCLRLKAAGLRNVYVAEARLTHRESESRGDDRSPEQTERFSAELHRLQERWQTEDYVDPHYSPLFSRVVEQCVLSP